MFWMHGGGWTMGSIEMEDYKLRSICVELQISILNVEYRLAPEHKHPTPLNDCYTALKWATENATLFSADLSKGFIIAGASAGAHLAAVIAHRVRDDPFFKDRQLTGQILQIPTVVDPSAIPEEHKSSYLSLEQNKDAPGLTKKMVLWGWEQLGGSATDPEVSPLLYPSHKGLAPAFMQVCGMDPLRDEAFLYEKMLNKDGVNTRLRVYPGVPHAFSYRFPALKSAIKWNDEYRTGLEWLLDGAPS
ncbi:Alpha/beta hydrolase fold-3 [Mycena rebaudengoi]|nr:Alpha/beta hydrolase fold-3 [Mycena rebaudengoi]